MKYNDELAGELRKIREEFRSLYQSDPAGASEHLRKTLLDLNWDDRIKNTPKEFRSVLVDLRTVSRKSEGATYSSEQMTALSDALELCEKYEISSKETFDVADAIENSGLDSRLIFNEETIYLLKKAIEKLPGRKTSALYS